MTYEQAACFPVALQTMHNAVVIAGRLKRGETLLIQGASSGVGLMGMQIGKLMGAAMVMGTSTNSSRRARLKEYGGGASAVIEAKTIDPRVRLDEAKPQHVHR